MTQPILSLAPPFTLIHKALTRKLERAGEFRLVSRKFIDWANVLPAQRPALIVTQGKDDHAPDFTGQPSTIMMNFTVFLYLTTDYTKDDPAPIDYVNDWYARVVSLLAPDPVLMVCDLGSNDTLGGPVPLVNHCWIEGTVLKIPGDLDGDAIVVIPVKALIPA